jgi:hypothetical protein
MLRLNEKIDELKVCGSFFLIKVISQISEDFNQNGYRFKIFVMFALTGAKRRIGGGLQSSKERKTSTKGQRWEGKTQLGT